MFAPPVAPPAAVPAAVVGVVPTPPEPEPAPGDPDPDPLPDEFTGVTPGHAWAKAAEGLTVGGVAAGLAGPGFWKLHPSTYVSPVLTVWLAGPRLAYVHVLVAGFPCQ